MRNNSTIESLKAMRFSAMAAELERQGARCALLDLEPPNGL